VPQNFTHPPLLITFFSSHTLTRPSLDYNPLEFPPLPRVLSVFDSYVLSLSTQLTHTLPDTEDKDIILSYYYYFSHRVALYFCPPPASFNTSVTCSPLCSLPRPPAYSLLVTHCRRVSSSEHKYSFDERLSRSELFIKFQKQQKSCRNWQLFPHQQVPGTYPLISLLFVSQSPRRSIGT
jgi:hypothetical protein